MFGGWGGGVRLVKIVTITNLHTNNKYEEGKFATQISYSLRIVHLQVVFLNNKIVLQYL